MSVDDNYPTEWLQIFSSFPIPEQRVFPLVCKLFYNLLKPFFPIDYSIDTNLQRKKWHQRSNYSSSRTKTDFELVDLLVCHYSFPGSPYFLLEDKVYGSEQDQDWELGAIGVCPSKWQAVMCRLCRWMNPRKTSNFKYSKFSIKLRHSKTSEIIQIYFQKWKYDHPFPCLCDQILTIPK